MNNLCVTPGEYVASAWLAISAENIKEIKHHINVMENGDVFEYGMTDISGSFERFENLRRWHPHDLIHYTLIEVN